MSTTAMQSPQRANVAPDDTLRGHDLAEAIYEAHGRRINAFARRRRLRGERGAVVVRRDAPDGPLVWITYDAATLHALGIHWNDHVGMWMRHDRDTREGLALQQCVVVDEDGRRVTDLRWRVDGADGRGGAR